MTLQVQAAGIWRGEASKVAQCRLSRRLLMLFDDAVERDGVGGDGAGIRA